MEIKLNNGPNLSPPTPEEERKERARAESEKKVNDAFLKLTQDYTSPGKQATVSQVKAGTISEEDFLQEVKRHISEKYFHLSEKQARKTLKLFKDFVFGYSRLTDLINDDDISDIHCLAWNNIRVKRKGKREASKVKFSSEEEFNRLIDAVGTKNGVSTSATNAIQRFTDPDSNKKFILRFTISTQVVNACNHSYLVIRKVPKNFPEMDDLVEVEMMDKTMKDFLVRRFQRGSLLICGGNSSGKTTLLNALKETIPDTRSVLVCQQAEELTTKRHPDMFFLNELPPTSEAAVSYSLKDISIMGLTFDIDYFLIGEIKGAEALYLLNSAYTGQICAATIHADDAKHGLNKLADYALYESHYNREELMKMLECFKTVVFMKNYKVTQVVIVEGWNADSKDLDYRIIYQRDISKDEENSVADGEDFDYLKVED